MMKLLSALIIFALLCGCRSEEESSPPVVVAVKVARAERADVELSVTAPARLYAVDQANVSSRVTAPIARLLVRKGDAVRQDQLVAELDDRDLVAQRQEAVAAVADAQATFEKTSQGTLPTDVERAQGDVAVAKAALDEAQKIEDRRKQLFDEGAIPQRDLIVSQSQLAQAQARYQVAAKSLELLQTQSQERDVRIAKSRLEQAQARLANIQAQLNFTRIRSPFPGYITEQFVWPGDMAMPNAPMFTVMDLSTIVARGQVPDSEAGPLAAGQKCVFVASDGSGSFDGRVSMVNHAVDPAARTVESWCRIPNSGLKLRAGMFGTLRFVTGTAPNSVVVPLSAVQLEEGTHDGTVYVVGPGGIAHETKIRAGVMLGDRAQILSGLKGGETVITEGEYGLPDGTKVRTTGGAGQ
jgi:HlyD family secretion protein